MSGYSLTPEVPPPAPHSVIPPPAHHEDAFLPGIPTPSMTPEVEPTTEATPVATRMNKVKKFFKSPLNTSLVSLFWTFVTFFAIYLSFKCSGGFKLGQFLMALLCSPLYIAYQLAVNSKKCFSAATVVLS